MKQTFHASCCVLKIIPTKCLQSLYDYKNCENFMLQKFGTISSIPNTGMKILYRLALELDAMPFLPQFCLFSCDSLSQVLPTHINYVV